MIGDCEDIIFVTYNIITVLQSCDQENYHLLIASHLLVIPTNVLKYDLKYRSGQCCSLLLLGPHSMLPVVEHIVP